MQLKCAPPDKAAEIIKNAGYPINAKLLRRWAKEGKYPAVWTGKRLLINIEKAIQFLETNTPQI